MTPSRSILAITALLAAAPAAATAIDIRDCPLDTVVFVDPWAGGSFSVARVGTKYFYICPEGVDPATDPGCTNPYGDLILEGTWRDRPDGEPVPRSAVWTVIKAAPCCDWNVEDGASVHVGTEGFVWLTPDRMPRLRDMPFLSIESEYGNDFGNPLHAASCTVR